MYISSPLDPRTHSVPKIFVVIIVLAVNMGPSAGQTSGEEFTLSILHVNDVHARFEQTNVYSGRCTPGDEENNRCYGGFARSVITRPENNRCYGGFARSVITRQENNRCYGGFARSVITRPENNRCYGGFARSVITRRGE
ncbi:hypothetical protein HAZT_HAZT011112 [Hyalella azteca]|uniref:Calcineurin-like phosphoesterase domain-containing protein n=1 Tax=Hyalella azteca TaxID=294128 RepID=A0A6A0H0S3_HYAAZ|nr:hypothetical protein HAZT_HAZT011112 [Hyalella azteca]